jgi:hypothetical protein
MRHARHRLTALAVAVPAAAGRRQRQQIAPSPRTVTSIAVVVAVVIGAFALGVLVGRYLLRGPPRRRSSVELRGNGSVQPQRRGRHRAW